ncbi:HAD-IIB family hydrolase [Caenimonas sp. SL110]|uniref:HAD-IIB family hydrolase n=1 Tax=Caenimonas sp. SL110 TaxID=1450524 RepID=UPI000654690B|nr:HAD-IIB family hydrolase [Caenimonas sp. SL110]
MLKLIEWPVVDRRRITGVFTDIDDTLTTEGVVTGDALQALADLHAAGIRVVPITGRPVGWSEPFALQWPVDAIVAENGAVALRPHPSPLPEGEGAAMRLEKIYQQDVELRTKNYARMQEVAQRIVAEVPGATISRDSAGRETDIAIDHSEYTHLPPHGIAQVVKLMELHGMNATVSSIHINGWYGDHNKLAGARWIVRELYGRELDDEIDNWVYVGDSTNDVLMFEHFPHSVGVANIRRFEAQLSHPPKYITPSERGAGFAEVARAILER